MKIIKCLTAYAVGMLWITGFIGVIFGSCLAEAKDAKELIVFAGSGMRAPLDEISETYEKKVGVKILYDFEGSGSLGNKILAGQKPDIFIPGSEKWAKILKERKFINSYAGIAFHTPVIITPLDGSSDASVVTSLADFVKKDIRIVLGDERAAAIGKPSMDILKAAGIDVHGLTIKARGMTVKQLVMWVEGNNADASIVWQADALQSGRVKIIDIPEQINRVSIIPVCLLTENKKESVDFYNFLLSIGGKNIFAKHGFKVMGDL